MAPPDEEGNLFGVVNAVDAGAAVLVVFLVDGPGFAVERYYRSGERNTRASEQ